MRKIDNKSIFSFFAIVSPALSTSAILSHQFVEYVEPSDSRLILKIILFLLFAYLSLILMYRLFLFLRPLKIGYIEDHSSGQTTYNIYVLFYLLFFNPLLPTLLIPVPMMRMIYQCLGARFGDNSYSSGVILDPPLVQIGSNTILGYDSVICPHAVEGENVYFAPIKIGDRVTIGMRSILMAGVQVDDHAIVAAGSIVLKGTHIKSREVWAGTPARKIKSL